jgi:hypothetical protein
MNKILYGFIALTFLLTGCENSNSDAPIQEDEMVELLVEIHFVDAMVLRGVNQGAIKNPETYSYYKSVLEKHGIDRAIFDSAFDYYSKDFKKLDKMYNRVLSELKKKQEQLELAEKEAAKQKQQE